jgi:hypothetical protein
MCLPLSQAPGVLVMPSAKQHARKRQPRTRYGSRTAEVPLSSYLELCCVLAVHYTQGRNANRDPIGHCGLPQFRNAAQ